MKLSIDNNLRELFTKLTTQSRSPYLSLADDRPEPTTLREWLELGTRLSEGHNPGAAFQCWIRALEVDPDSPEANLNVGLDLVDRGDYATALDYLQRHLRVHPGNEIALGGIADALMGMGRVDDALQEYRHVTEILPGFPGPWRSLGQALCKAGQYEAALDAYNEAISIKPNSDSKVELGHVLMALGRRDEALQIWRQIASDDRYASGNRKMAQELIKEHRR
ncbi:MAG: tetratricopeptide repeat protein [Capsulimonadaceae bacterium]